MIAGDLHAWLMAVLAEHGPNVDVAGDDDGGGFTAYDPVTIAPLASTREP